MGEDGTGDEESVVADWMQDCGDIGMQGRGFNEIGG